MPPKKSKNWFANFIKKGGHKNLTLQIFIALVLAFGFAWFFPQQATYVKFGGEIFLNLLKMMVVPLVITSVMSGIFGMGDVRKLGKPGGTAIGYYICTTILAVLIGLLVVNIFKPGGGMSEESVAAAQATGAGDQAAEQKVIDFIADGSEVEEDKLKKIFGFDHEAPKTTWDIVQNLSLIHI